MIFICGLTNGAATIPVLPRIPMLLKWIEGRPNNRYLQWGDHNGTWSFRTLLPTEAPLFNHLLFPPPEEAPLTIKSAHITTEMYTILSKGHTVARYDLSEYRENTENFIGNDESIEIVEHFPTFFREHVNHLDPWQNQLWNKIGVAQQNFPAWIVQLWVGDFNYRIENVEDAIIKSRSSSLHLKDHYPHPEFYNMKLGDNKFNKVYLNQPNTTYSLYLVKYSGSGIEYRRSRYQWECLLNPDKMRILEEVTKIKFMPLADLITQIDQVPSEAHRESTQLTAENGLNVNSVQEVIKSYKHYKNRYFGLAWLSTSIGTLTIIQRLQQASDNEERYKLAEEYLAHNSDRNGNASTKFAEVLQRKMGR